MKLASSFEKRVDRHLRTFEKRHPRVCRVLGYLIPISAWIVVNSLVSGQWVPFVVAAIVSVAWLFQLYYGLVGKIASRVGHVLYNVSSMVTFYLSRVTDG